MTKYSTDKKKSLSGVVLIMVVTVMFVLIILLLATLSVVQTAQNRYYAKFEENQAYYTARSALDLYTKDLLGDKNYYAYEYTYDSSGNAIGETIKTYKYGNNQTANMKQGLALQLDLYTITAQSGMNVKQSVINAYNPADAADKRDEYKTYYGTDSAKVMTKDGKEYLEYRVTVFPKISDASGEYGLMIDSTAGKKGNNAIEAIIRVEVLDRTYNLDTKYIEDGTFADEAAIMTELNAASAGTNRAKALEAFAKGNRSKDIMRLKVTATVKFMGVEGKAVLVYDTNEPPVNNSSRAVTTFGGTGFNNMNIIGGLSTLSKVDWGNDGHVYGNIFADDTGLSGTDPNWKYAGTNPTVFLTESECFYIAGDASNGTGSFKVTTNGMTSNSDKEKRPFVYIGGNFTAEKPNIGKGNDGGTDLDKVDLIVKGDVSCPSGSDFNVNGDVYVLGNCNLNSSKVNVNGDLYVYGNLTAKEVNVTGGLLYVGGTYQHYNYGSNMYEVDSPSGGACPEFKLDDTNDDPNTAGVEIELPGSVKKILTTNEINYDMYYQVDSSGNIKTPKTPVTAEQKAFTGAEDMKTGNYSTDKFTALSIDETKIGGNGSGVSTINVAAEKTFLFKSGCGSTTYYGGQGGSTTNYLEISGGGTVNIVLEPGTYVGNIVVADDTQLNVYAPVGNYTFQWWTVWTKTIFDAYKSSPMAAINVGDKEGCGIKVPKINYYFEEGSTIKGDLDFLMCGYIYAPGASINVETGCKTYKFNYNGASAGNLCIGFIGSVLCNELKFKDAKGGVAYINPNLADGGAAGEPIHNWAANRYTRK